MFTRLLAKSTEYPDDPKPEETLAGHLEAVALVAKCLLDQRGNVTLGALGLSTEGFERGLYDAVVRAAALHDIGKANDQFQYMVRGQRTLPQAIRHEVVGVLILASFPALDRWLFGGVPQETRLMALRAVIGHHLRFDPGSSLNPAASGAAGIHLLLGHPDFARALDAIGRMLDLGTAPSLESSQVPLVASALAPVLDLVWDADDWWQRTAGEVRRLNAAAAALVIAADVCGSMFTRSGADPAAWATGALAAGCSGGDLRSAAKRRVAGKTFRPFQQAMAESDTRVTMVTAGCGSGKTAGAYLWAGSRLQGRKLFFCYPTTGTTTEGFLDYAFPEFQHDAALIHSRAEFDIERFLENGDEDARHFLQASRYKGVQVWGSRAVVCTADSVLGLVQNNRLGLFAFPALAGAGFVFDEVHLYDDRMFGSLLTFIGALPGAPVLIMTATLQPARRTAILTAVEQSGGGVTEISGPPELEDLPRYVIEAGDGSRAWAEADQILRRGGRVLWVTNTVGRAVGVGQEAEAHGLRVEPYHSRYRYVDRLARHEAVMQGFRAETHGRGFLAVTTQVCEVSLDISADLLVTECAPPEALIQRLGRLNRRATPGSGGRPCPAIVITPENPLPYGARQLELGRSWLAGVSGRVTSQTQLSDVFKALVAGDPPPRRTESAWLDRAWTLLPAAVREAGATMTFLRQEDRDRCVRAGHPLAAQITKYAIPMPWSTVASEALTWPNLGGALVAPAGRIDYSERWGARWST